jgi:hypothetical protein
MPAPAAVGVVHLPRGALPQRGIAVRRIMEGFEARQLCRQMGPVAEGLAPPEELVIPLVKALDDPMAPGLPLGDENRLHAQVQTAADEQAKTAWVPVGAATGELVVHLQVTGASKFLPAGHPRVHHIWGLLAGYGCQGHRMAVVRR